VRWEGAGATGDGACGCEGAGDGGQDELPPRPATPIADTNRHGLAAKPAPWLVGRHLPPVGRDRRSRGNSSARRPIPWPRKITKESRSANGLTSLGACRRVRLANPHGTLSNRKSPLAQSLRRSRRFIRLSMGPVAPSGPPAVAPTAVPKTRPRNGLSGSATTAATFRRTLPPSVPARCSVGSCPPRRCAATAAGFSSEATTMIGLDLLLRTA
jgi:hypothetical protein